MAAHDRLGDDRLVRDGRRDARVGLATFSAVRSSNRSARIAEESLLTAMRPLLVPSLAEDPDHKVLWHDRHTARVSGGRAIVEQAGGVIHLAIGLRNLGTGIALLHGWHPMPDQVFGDRPHIEAEDSRRLAIDLYIPAGGPATGRRPGRPAGTDRRPRLPSGSQMIRYAPDSAARCGSGIPSPSTSSTATNRAVNAPSVGTPSSPQVTTAGTARWVATGIWTGRTLAKVRPGFWSVVPELGMGLRP